MKMKGIIQEVKGFFDFFGYYLKRKVIVFSVRFEKNKNRLVKFFLMKRGRYNRPFLHITTMAVLGVGVLISPFLADTFPLFTSQETKAKVLAASAEKQSMLVGEEVFQTEVSAKPRDKTINYRIERGDTISTIAKKFNISEDTIKWENSLTSDTLTVGDQLRILPVSGIAHKVVSGESIYTIAKKFNTDAQKIADFPFNEFAGNGEDFKLVTGQIVIVPDGIKPSEQQYIKRQVYLAQGPVAVSTGGFTYPVRGELSQLYSWYHTGLDIATSVGTPIVAAHNGTVTEVRIGTYDGGYGTNIYISNGDGVVSHYAHLGSVSVSAGQKVVGGSTVIGTIGMTGRTTGPHLHFEIRNNGALVNPLSYIQ